MLGGCYNYACTKGAGKDYQKFLGVALSSIVA